MPHDFSKLFADLDAAKSDLQRQVRHSRAFIAEQAEGTEPRRARVARRLFGWTETPPD